ncbi:uncharacterized protein [Arachis hypogaea]|uniref:uncharacterized protein n=1 Tax=Arachis hypogaea TaxID=3818 RepID=UPI003B2175DE
MGDPPLSKIIDVQYFIVDCPSPYNIILGRPALNNFRAVVSTLHFLKKASNEPKTNQRAGVTHTASEVLSLSELDPREDFQERPEPTDELEKIPLMPKAELFTYISRALEGEERARLIRVLQDNVDLFAWTPTDMLGIDPNIICHKLAINKTSKPIAQKKRNLREEKMKVALEETKKLLNAGFIKELRFTTWLSNVVMNARATYQRLMDKVFQQQIGRNMEIYVDDMVAKTSEQGSHCDDLEEILTKPELAGCLTKWSVKLSEYDVQYQPRKTPKLQILADFISELTTEDREKEYKLYVDGASNKTESGAGVTLNEGEQVIVEQSLQFSFPASNNQAEYEALLAGLKLAQDLQIHHLTVYCDSLLVVQQIKGDFQVKDPLLERYWLITKDLISKFHEFKIVHVNREQNTRADVLSKLATTRPHSHTPTLSQLTLEKPSFELNGILSITQDKDWRTPFLKYIKTGVIPTDEQNEKLFRRRASYYTVVGESLYRRGLSQPLLKCLNKSEAEIVMAETHEGVCENHIGGRALSTKILQAGYYWLTMKRDCIAKVKKCDNCQKHAMISTTPAEKLHTLEVSWPFDRWGLDILGPFPKAPGQVKFLLVSIDYFSKWIEAQPLAWITAEKVRSFLWKNIICRYGIPREIISDNGRQFTDQHLALFSQNFNIKHHFSSVEHPETNGQVESDNRVILQALKKKLDDAKGKWADLVPEVLWGYNTIIQSSTGETPFKLVYGAEALIPVEIGVPTLQTELYDQNKNNKERTANLDLVDEEREIATIKQLAIK